MSTVSDDPTPSRPETTRLAGRKPTRLAGRKPTRQRTRPATPPLRTPPGHTENLEPVALRPPTASGEPRPGAEWRGDRAPAAPQVQANARPSGGDPPERPDGRTFA